MKNDDNNRIKAIRNIRVKYKWSSTTQKQIRINLNPSQQQTLKHLQDILKRQLSINVSAIVLVRASLELFAETMNLKTDQGMNEVLRRLEGAAKYE